MFKPKFQTLIKVEQFTSDEDVCLGSQLIQIVNVLKEILKPHFWYGANLFSFDEFRGKNKQNSFNTFYIGDDNELIKIASNVEQFLSGVLFAVDEQCISQKIDHLSIDTEDEQYREVDMKDVLLEIRLFDTSFFSIFSEKYDIIEKLSKKFKTNIVKKNQIS